jgi:hypothetical protein
MEVSGQLRAPAALIPGKEDRKLGRPGVQEKIYLPLVRIELESFSP